jgi:YggT family protein
MSVILALMDILRDVIGIYQFAILAYVILGWLEHFNVVNRYNQAVYTIHTFLFRIIEPVLNKIRRVVPMISGIDLSPFVLLLFLSFLVNVISRSMR